MYRHLCSNCCKEVEIELRKEYFGMHIDGICFGLYGRTPYCMECGQEMFIKELMQEFVDKIYNKHKEAKG